MSAVHASRQEAERGGEDEWIPQQAVLLCVNVLTHTASASPLGRQAGRQAHTHTHTHARKP